MVIYRLFQYIVNVADRQDWVLHLERVRKSASQTVHAVSMENPIKHVGDALKKSKRINLHIRIFMLPQLS